MTGLRDKLAKLEAMTVARGASPSEAEVAARKAAEIRAQLTAEKPPEPDHFELMLERRALVYALMQSAWFSQWQIAGFEGDSDKLESLDDVSDAHRYVAKTAFASGSRVMKLAHGWSSDRAEVRGKIYQAMLAHPEAGWRKVLEVSDVAA